MSSGADKIVSNIMSEAQGNADVNLEKAQAEANAIIAEGEKQAEAEKVKISEDAKKQAAMRHQQIISEAKMNARRAELGAKEEVIEEAFNKATSDLKNIATNDDEKYIPALITMIKEAATEIGGGDLIILLKDGDAEKVKGEGEGIDKIKSLLKDRNKPLDLKSLAKEISSETGVETTLDIGEPIDCIGGAILRTRNGDIQVNNTIESRMLRFKKSLRSEVAKTLFN